MINVIAYQVIDTVTEVNKKVVDTVVSNQDINTVLNTFIDTQNKLTKDVVDASLTAMSGVLGIVTTGKFHKDCMDQVWCRK
jgi:hypothetical protein